LRVLYIDHTAKLGGGEIALANLLRYLNLDVVEPIAIFFEKGPLLDRISQNVETHIFDLDPEVSSTSKDTLGWGSVLKLAAVIKVIRHVAMIAKFAREKHVDVIHTNSLKADIIGGLAGRLAGTPVVWHVRDRIDNDYLPASIVRIFRFLAGVVPAYVIANSAATLATIHLGKRRPSKVIGSGVDISKYPEPTFKVRSAGSETRIGLVGRLAPWKGQHIFIQAAAKVLSQYPQTRFEIVGGALFNESMYEAEIREMTKTLGIEHAIEFTGFVNDVPARVANLDILVHASTTGEPYGQVIIEGMAAGKPVIATNGGGVPEIVVAGVTGLLVSMDSVDEMTEAIRYLLSDPNVCLRMGRNGRARVLEQFTVNQTAHAVEQVYQELLRDR
jgi:glycosyltransferase involved in cell wall biosynthesis